MLSPRDIKAKSRMNMNAILGRVKRIVEIRAVLNPGFISAVNRPQT